MGRKAELRAQRTAAARARDEATGAEMLRLKDEDPGAWERALGMALHDFKVTQGRHPAARKFIAIAQERGLL